MIPDPSDLVDRWLGLCTDLGIRGRSAHDARLVAWMRGNGITHLLTLEAGFARYPGIACIAPSSA
ncbi:MAG: hypothetical protein AB1716_11815 [Planctomycetota bacterium]